MIIHSEVRGEYTPLRTRKHLFQQIFFLTMSLASAPALYCPAYRLI